MRDSIRVTHAVPSASIPRLNRLIRSLPCAALVFYVYPQSQLSVLFSYLHPLLAESQPSKSHKLTRHDPADVLSSLRSVRETFSSFLLSKSRPCFPVLRLLFFSIFQFLHLSREEELSSEPTIPLLASAPVNLCLLDPILQGLDLFSHRIELNFFNSFIFLHKAL